MAWLDSSGKLQPLVSTPGVSRVLAFRRTGEGWRSSRPGCLCSRPGTGHHQPADVQGPTSGLRRYGRPMASTSCSGPLGTAIFWIRSDGAAIPNGCWRAENVLPWSFSPDGQRLAYLRDKPRNGLRHLDFAAGSHRSRASQAGQAGAVPADAANEQVPRFSPDGRWIAYASDESGNYEIYVRPFPAGSGGKWQISNGGGRFPHMAPRWPPAFLRSVRSTGLWWWIMRWRALRSSPANRGCGRRGNFSSLAHRTWISRRTVSASRYSCRPKPLPARKAPCM